MAIINAIAKNRGCSKEEAKNLVKKCYAAVKRNMERHNGDVAKTMQVMLGVGGIYIVELFAIGSGSRLVD